VQPSLTLPLRCAYLSSPSRRLCPSQSSWSYACLRTDAHLPRATCWRLVYLSSILDGFARRPTLDVLYLRRQRFEQDVRHGVIRVIHRSRRRRGRDWPACYCATCRRDVAAASVFYLRSALHPTQAVHLHLSLPSRVMTCGWRSHTRQAAAPEKAHTFISPVPCASFSRSSGGPGFSSTLLPSPAL